MKPKTMLTIEEVRRRIDIYKPAIVMKHTNLSYGALYAIKSGRDTKYSTVKKLSDFILAREE
jgi:predicted transcriptional regulator